jgi:hypothetical protein
MNCTNCDAPLEPNAKFCGECGQPVTSPSSESSSALKCTHCGAVLDPSFRFCGECGQPVSQDSIPEPPAVKLPSAKPIPPPAAVPERTPPPPAMQSPPAPQMKPPPGPSVTPAAMASQPKPPPGPGQQPPPVPPVVQPVASPTSRTAPKKRRTGCVIAIIVVIVLIFCCVAASLIGWYVLDNSSFNIDLPFLDDLLGRNSEIPPIDWILGDTTAITFANASGLDVCMIYVTPSNSLDFSEDLLMNEGILNSGDNFTAYIESWQSVEILVLDCDRSTVYESYDVYLSDESVLITISPP